MRELKRSIARSKMRDQGIARINKKTIEIVDENGKPTGEMASFFSAHWREFIGEKSRRRTTKKKPHTKSWIKRFIKKLSKYKNDAQKEIAVAAAQ